jgi:hypothetical protein
MSRSIVRDAHFGALRGRPQACSMSCSRASTASSDSSVVNPTTRLMKSGPSNPTAAFRYAREKRASGHRRAISAQARARFFSGSTLLPAAT